MIKIENVEVNGFEAAIRGLRNPMNSWDKSDSHTKADFQEDHVWIGQKDLTLMKQLVKAGSDHSKFMRMIIVTCDITAPLYWTKQLDTYKIGTVRNSCSTMHKIHAKDFVIEDFSTEYIDTQDGLNLFQKIIDRLNYLRRAYVDARFIDDWDCANSLWGEMIQLLPSCYNQHFTWQANYQVLRNIYHSRKNHKLSCWKTFCEWVETLPYSDLIIMEEKV